MRCLAALSTLVFAVALTLTLPCALAASGAPSHWLPPTIGLAPDGSSDVSVAVSGDLAVAIWETTSGLETSSRQAGGGWERPLRLIAGGFFSPQLAMDGHGNAVVTMSSSESPTSGSRVVTYLRSAGAVSWSGPTPISSPSWDLGPQDLALNEAGEGVVAWRAADRPEDYSSGVIRASIRTREGSWESPLNLGYAGSQIEEPKTAVDGRGNALVLWARNGRMFVAYRSAGGWQPTTSFATGIGWGNYDVVMNRRGDALAVWGDPDGQMISARRPAATGSWSSPVRVPVTSPLQGLGAYSGLSFALDEQGNALLVEGRDDGQVEALTLRSSDEQWQAPAVLGTSGGTSAWYAHDNWCVRPRVAVDAAGGTLVVWGGSSLYAVRRPAGSNGWQKPVVVTADHACWGRAVAVDEAGGGVVLFNSGENARRLDAAILDVTPPLLGTVRVPKTAVAGKRVRFSLAARDRWSRVAAVEWRFGDGARAHGRGLRSGDTVAAAAMHTYRRPGRYSLTVIVTDQVGNVMRRALSVVVRAR